MVVTSSPSNVIVPDVGSIEPQHEPADRRLAAARLADQPERLAALDLEGDVVDGLDLGDGPLQHAAAHREVLHQVAHLDEGGGSARAATVVAGRAAITSVGLVGRAAPPQVPAAS